MLKNRTKAVRMPNTEGLWDFGKRQTATSGLANYSPKLGFLRFCDFASFLDHKVEYQSSRIPELLGLQNFSLQIPH